MKQMYAYRLEINGALLNDLEFTSVNETNVEARRISRDTTAAVTVVRTELDGVTVIERMNTYANGVISAPR